MAVIRPTKKQKILIDFIAQFIAEHGFSPSYREIMNGLNYTSVATVAAHVNNLIKRGHLRKRDRSARSLEVVAVQLDDAAPTTIGSIAEHEAKWLIQQVDALFEAIENAEQTEQAAIDKLFVMVGALRILGQEGAVQSFIPRLSLLKQRVLATQEAPAEA